MFSIDGLVSGLDTTAIIEGLLSIQKSQIDRLDFRKQEIQFRQTAFQGIEANAVALKSAAQRLNSFTNNVFSVFSATSSDEGIVQAAASKNAQSGSYQLTVTQLASSAQSASQGLASSESLITEGGIEIKVGNRPAVLVEIDSSNNTLSGLADSINSSGSDVKASVINDGNGYRILLSSQHTGAENQIVIDNKTDASSGSLTQIDFSGPAVQTATDSIVRLGSGTGAIDISRSTNTLDNIISGLTLNLRQADAGKTVTISVARDTADAREAIEGFVSAFNTVMSYIDAQTTYNAESDEAGLLLGNSATNNIRDQLRGTLSRSVANITSKANRLSAIGIEFDDKGKLQINSATLDNALSGKIEGVGSAEIRRLFALGATSTSPGVTFVSGSAETGTSTSPWQVNITQVAKQASVSSTNAVASSVTIDALNDTLSIKVDGLSSGQLKLAHGTYTQENLAKHVQSVINQAPDLGSRDVTVSVADNKLVIESVVYGTKSEVGTIAGTAAATLGFTGTETNRGKDVAGYFIVDGETELATGNGRLLSGDSGNKNTDGLQLRVTLSTSQVVGVHQSNLTVTRGLAATLENVIDSMLDPDSGRFSNTIDSYENQIKSIDDSVVRFNKIFDAKQKQLIAEFAAIETSISSLQNTSSFLASQLGGISQLSNRRN